MSKNGSLRYDLISFYHHEEGYQPRRMAYLCPVHKSLEYLRDLAACARTTRLKIEKTLAVNDDVVRDVVASEHHYNDAAGWPGGDTSDSSPHGQARLQSLNRLQAVTGTDALGVVHSVL